MAATHDCGWSRDSYLTSLCCAMYALYFLGFRNTREARGAGSVASSADSPGARASRGIDDDEAHILFFYTLCLSAPFEKGMRLGRFAYADCSAVVVTVVVKLFSPLLRFCCLLCQG